AYRAPDVVLELRHVCPPRVVGPRRRPIPDRGNSRPRRWSRTSSRSRSRDRLSGRHSTHSIHSTASTREISGVVPYQHQPDGFPHTCGGSPRGSRASVEMCPNRGCVTDAQEPAMKENLEYDNPKTTTRDDRTKEATRDWQARHPESCATANNVYKTT